jgi:hypothetical protein
MQLQSLNNAFEELARIFEAKRQALTQILSKKFENERSLLEDKVVKILSRADKEIVQADQAINQIKVAVQSNSQVAVLSHLFGSFTKSMQGTKELIAGI